MGNELASYTKLFSEIKQRIRRAQARAAAAANRELLTLYWDIGRMLVGRQEAEGWGSGVLRRLATDLKNEFADLQGFSERNINLMTQFYREYPDLPQIGQQSVSQLSPADSKVQRPVALLQPLNREDVTGIAPSALELPALVCSLSWSVNILLIQKVKDIPTRKWYMIACIDQGWGRDTLAAMIKSRAHERQGSAVTNFDLRLPAPQSEMAKEMLKDPYVFDFLSLEKPFHERELEAGLIEHLEKFLLELGSGFTFAGRQYHLDVGDDDFYIDLLFYHLKLRCFIVIDLKRGPFKPEYAGKVNFYCNVVDDTLKHEQDRPTIGLILCQEKKKVLAEYALRGMSKPIGVSEYELTRSLPEEFKSSLPTIEEIEAELSGEVESE